MGLIRLKPDPTRYQTPDPTRYQNSSTTISGRVVADNTGEPLPNVRITSRLSNRERPWC